MYSSRQVVRLALAAVTDGYTSSKRRADTKMYDKGIFIPAFVPVRVEGKIDAGRAYGQQILQTESDAGPEVREEIFQGV
jgi:hypothetical protein